MGLPEFAAALRIRHVEFFARAGHGYITQAAFFFQFVFVVFGNREQPFFHTRHKHVVKFQPFG